MENRLEKVEDKLSDIKADQSAIRTSVTMMEKTLTELADVRSEQLHIMKQQEEYKQDHDEIFTRLRKAEQGRASCDEKHKFIKNDVIALKKNQRWGIVLIIGSFLSLIIKKTFF